MQKKVALKKVYLVGAALLSLIIIVIGGVMTSVNSQRAGTPSLQADEISDLLLILRDTKVREQDPQRLTKAIERIGELKAPAAVEDLVQLITYNRKFEWERDDVINEIRLITIGNRYPAISALSQIGKPSLPAVIKVVKTHEIGSVESENAVFVVQTIFREHLSEGIDYLKEAASVASSPEEVQRLLNAAEVLNKRAK